MMETVGHYVYFMQCAVSMSDGEQEEEETQAIIEMAQSQQLYNLMTGTGRDQQEVFDEAVDYFNKMCAAGSVGMAFAHAAGGIAAAVEYDNEALSGFYNGLVAVAAADGEIEPAERKLLDYAKGEWGV